MMIKKKVYHVIICSRLYFVLLQIMLFTATSFIVWMSLYVAWPDCKQCKLCCRMATTTDSKTRKQELPGPNLEEDLLDCPVGVTDDDSYGGSELQVTDKDDYGSDSTSGRQLASCQTHTVSDQYKNYLSCSRVGLLSY